MTTAENKCAGASAPAPLVPDECDLRDFRRMMLDIPRLRASAFDGIQDDTAWRAGLNLWMSAFHSVPAASLDNDEGALCKAAGLGRDLRTWRKVQPLAMRGWALCSDGRWYHATVAEVALEAWLEKLLQRLASGAGNAKRWSTVFDPAPVKAAIADAAGRLRLLNPDATVLRKAAKHISSGNPPGSENGSGGNPPRPKTPSPPMENDIPPDTNSTGISSQVEGEGEVEGVSTGEDKSSPGASAGQVIEFPGKVGDAGAPAANDKPAWWPVRDRYGRVLGDLTDKLLYDVGKAVLGHSAGGQVTRLRKLHPYRQDLRAAVELLLRADDEKSDPKSWFAAMLKRAEMDEPLDPKHVVFPESIYAER